MIRRIDAIHILSFRRLIVDSFAPSLPLHHLKRFFLTSQFSKMIKLDSHWILLEGNIFKSVVHGGVSCSESITIFCFFATIHESIDYKDITIHALCVASTSLGKSSKLMNIVYFTNILKGSRAFT